MIIVLILLCSVTAWAQLPAFPGAEGFGALASGGRGGDVYHVATLEDSGPGSLREGIETASGPRTIVFDIAGTIVLKDILWIRNSNLTIAGQTAPGDGICIRDYSVNINRANNIIIRYLCLRLGDIQTLARGKPTSSIGLDCVSIDDSRNIIFDHCSLSWSCDEVFGIVQNENVTIQWCLVAEPLGAPLLHPYSDHHAYGMNDSANTLSIHHCLISNYVMRGPEFEPNDAVNGQGYDVKMEAVNNVLFDYKKSGSRYKTGIEDNPEAASDISFQFHFLNNYYIRKHSSDAPEIHAVTKFDATNQLKVFVDGNIGPNRPTNSLNPWKSVWVENGPNILEANSSIKAQMAAGPLFESPAPITMQSAEAAYAKVLEETGCSIHRDSVDLRLVDDVKKRRFRDYLHSQNDVGGWPTLTPGTAAPDADLDGMPDWWEESHGLDKTNPDDRNDDADLDGYTNLEDYLNGGIIAKVEETLAPGKYGFLLQNYPNPFNSQTTIKYQVARQTVTEINIYNALGARVRALVDEEEQPGLYTMTWDGKDAFGKPAESGIYFCRLGTDNFARTTKLLLIR